MKFNIFGLSLVFTRNKNEKNNLTMDDLNVIGSDTERYIQSLTDDDLKDRVESVSLISFNDSVAARELLERAGIVIVPGFLSPEVVDSCLSTIQKIRTDASALMESAADYVESSEALIQKGTARVSGYVNLVRYPKVVVLIRQGQDEGMIDVFNVDQISPELREKVRPRFEDSAVLELLGSRDKQLHPSNLNLYINNGVESTRGFHVDSYQAQLKAFIYLTDVLSLADGPYVYIKGTHKESSYRRFNRAVSPNLPIATEAPLVPHRDIVPVLARRGSLVISDQSGIHRGFPQSKDHSRAVAVMNYK